MIQQLIEIAVFKIGNKRKLGIYLGFNEKYAGQRVNEIIKNQNIKYDLLQKLLTAAELDRFVTATILAEHKKIFKK